MFVLLRMMAFLFLIEAIFYLLLSIYLRSTKKEELLPTIAIGVIAWYVNVQ